MHNIARPMPPSSAQLLQSASWVPLRGVQRSYARQLWRIVSRHSAGRSLREPERPNFREAIRHARLCARRLQAGLRGE